jgi:predicted RNase H-like HicB family nuclease
MHYQAALEDIEPNHWIVWILDLPGCYSSAKTSTEAIDQASASIPHYFEWISLYDPILPVNKEPMEIEIIETFQSYPSKRDPNYIVNAFFEDDKRKVNFWDIATVLHLLNWSHMDLLKVIRAMDERRLRIPITSEVRESITKILIHVAGAENWYLGMLDLGLDRNQLFENPVDRIEQVRSNTKEQLWKLNGLGRVVENNDEK